MTWNDLAMDFIEALPRVNNKTMILQLLTGCPRLLTSYH
jgi:hypothetical protein